MRYSYEDFHLPTKTEFLNALDLSKERLYRKQRDLNCRPDWDVIIQTTDGIFYRISMNTNDTNKKTIIFILSPRALWGAITRRCHWNNLEIGCHIEMERYPNEYNPDLHLLLSYFHI